MRALLPAGRAVMRDSARPSRPAGGCDGPASCGNHHHVSLLEISVTAGAPGPVVTLSGEADLTTVAELSETLTAQLASDVRHLTVDLSGLRFADSAVIRELVMAGRALKDRGGGLVLDNPQPAVARALSLLGVDQAIKVRDETTRSGSADTT
jgi:anti-anti-sigma factor